jgi:hypothetical protein
MDSGRWLRTLAPPPLRVDCPFGDDPRTDLGEIAKRSCDVTVYSN